MNGKHGNKSMKRQHNPKQPRPSWGLAGRGEGAANPLNARPGTATNCKPTDRCRFLTENQTETRVKTKPAAIRTERGCQRTRWIMSAMEISNPPPSTASHLIATPDSGLRERRAQRCLARIVRDSRSKNPNRTRKNIGSNSQSQRFAKSTAATNGWNTRPQAPCSCGIGLRTIAWVAGSSVAEVIVMPLDPHCASATGKQALILITDRPEQSRTLDFV